MKKKLYVIFFLFLSFFFGLFYFFNNSNMTTNKNSESFTDKTEINSDTIKNVKYVSNDQHGNEYIISAEEGEINFSNKDIIFLKNIEAKLIMNDLSEILIKSDFGKYNVINYETILNKNVIINNKDLKIHGNNLEFSLFKNLIIVSENVSLNYKENILKTDAIEMNLTSKDIKVFMFDNHNKVMIKSFN